MSGARRRAAFLDRDGTLVRDVGYARRPDDLALLGGVRDSLAKLRSGGFLLIVITNQSGIGRGFLREDEYPLQIERLAELLGSEARPDAHYYCPHHPTEALGAYRIECDCRKPKPGLFLRAIAEHGIDPAPRSRSAITRATPRRRGRPASRPSRPSVPTSQLSPPPSPAPNANYLVAEKGLRGEPRQGR